MDKLEAAVLKGRVDRQSTEQTASVWSALRPLSAPDRVMAKARIVTRDKTGLFHVPYDLLRTRLLQVLRRNGWRSILITSPTSGCGKTTTCLNLAFSFSRAPDRRVLAVELDLVRPRMAQMLGVRPELGVGELLSGDAPPASVFLRHGRNLALAIARGPERDSAEILGSATCAEALLAADAALGPDVVLYDLPPLFALDDTIAFAPLADCALVIAAEGVSQLREVDACVQQLSRSIEVVGVALNKSVFPRPSHYGGYYGYGYGDG